MILQAGTLLVSLIGSLGTIGRYGQLCGTSPPSFLFLPGRARAVLLAFGRMSLVGRALRRGVVQRRAGVWRKCLLELGACSSVG